MRKVTLLLALIVVLAALRLISTLSADWHYVVPAEPGELLYAAAFDDLLDEWALYEGRLSAQVENEMLRIGVEVAESLPFSMAQPYFSDFDLRVLARPTAGPLDNGYGVIFRAQNPQNYYFFLVSSDGHYQVQRAVDGEQKELSTWIPSPLVNPGLDADNQLRVVAQGNQFRFFINGEQVALCIPDNPDGRSTYTNGCIDGQMHDSLTDDSIGSGQLGVIVMTLDEPNVAVAFDNVLVYGPESIDE